MNDIDLIREYGPDAPRASSVVLTAARERLMTGATEARPRRRAAWPRRTAAGWSHRRRTALVLTTAMLAVAVSAVIASLTPWSTPHRPVRVHGGVALAALPGPVEFPLALRPVPPGHSGPSFSGQGSGMTAVYPSADGKNNVVLSVDTQPPDGHVSPAPKPVSVAGRPGQFFRLPPGIPVAADEMTLVWERKPGQWVSIGGDGRFGTEAAVLALAATVVEQPQPIPLQLRLAPAGWKLYAFKADVIITICEGNRHDTCIDVIRVAHVDPNFARDLIGVRRSSTVQVNGRPALLVETVDGWSVQAPLPDGSAFHLHAPGFLTGDQVIAIAAQVSLS